MKKTTKVLIGLTALLLVLKGVSSDYEHDETLFTPQKVVYGKGVDNESYNENVTMKIIGGYPAHAYRSENVYLLIDKETKEVSEYLLATEKGDSNNWFESFFLKENTDVHQVFEIPSGDLICYYYSEYNGKGLDYLNYLLEKSDLVKLRDLELYVEDETLKEWYCLSEIRSFEPEIVESIEKINLATKRLIKKN